MRSRRNRTIQSPIVLSACVCAIRSSDLTAVSGPLPAPQQQRPRTGVPFRAPSCARPRLLRVHSAAAVYETLIVLSCCRRLIATATIGRLARHHRCHRGRPAAAAISAWAVATAVAETRCEQSARAVEVRRSCDDGPAAQSRSRRRFGCRWVPLPLSAAAVHLVGWAAVTVNSLRSADASGRVWAVFGVLCGISMRAYVCGYVFIETAEFRNIPQTFHSSGFV